MAPDQRSEESAPIPSPGANAFSATMPDALRRSDLRAKGPAMAMGLRSSMALRWALFGVTLMAAVVAFEIVCRVVDVDFNPNPSWRFDPILGWTQERSANFKGLGAEGQEVQIEFNSLGFRDIEHSWAKPPGVRRIVVLGDSFSEAVQVNIEETYWKRLEALLNGQGSPQWEVINLGVGDHGNAQALLALREYGLKYSPDIVLSQIFPLNDICNNTIELAGLCRSRNDIYRPYFVEGERGELRQAWLQPTRQKLRRNLVSFGLLEKIYLTVVGHFSSDLQIHAKSTAARGFPEHLLLLTFAEEADQPQEIRNGWRMTERILEETAALSRKHGAFWLPAVFPFEARLRSKWDRFSAMYPSAGLVEDYPERRLGELFARLSARSVMLKPVLEREPDLVFPYIGGHLNAEAHRLAAEAIYSELLNSGVLAPDFARKPQS